ncbi:MAG: hypothetical protein GX552_08920 [Chloroflexi bacterium]|nr:hypothetical protein [Chloroflexota bacterium]
MFEQIIQRITRLVKMDFTVFSDLEHDQNANQEAMVVVGIAALLSAIGTLLSGGGFLGFLVQLITIFAISWLLWSFVTMFVGTRLFAGEADFWEVARALSYAMIPLALGFLRFIPCLGSVIGLIGSLLSLVLGFLAIREALDLPTDKALLTVIIGWVIVFVLQLVLLSLVGVAAFAGAAISG